MISNVEILVSHGRAAALTRCRPDAAWRPQRLERVVLRSPRGLELGDVLGMADDACDTSALAAGELIRRATCEDEAISRRLHDRSLVLLDDAQTQIESSGLPLLALDAEFLLDGREVYLHVLRWGDATLTPLVEHLNERYDTMVRIVDRSQTAHHDHEQGCSSCGSGGCGSCGDGGCGEKGCGKETCSSGAFKTADDLSAYFLKLREEMLSHPRVPLL